MDRRKGRERERRCCRYRRMDMEELGVGGGGGAVGDEGTEGGNHSAIRALSLGPVFITVQLL